MACARSLLVVLLLPVLLGAASAEPPPRDVMELSQHGSVLGPMARNKEPDDPEAKLGTFVAGLELMSEAKYEVAGELFDRLAESTGWPEAAYNASLAWYAAGRYDVALQRADRVIEVLPEDTGAMYLRGVLLQAVGRHEDATAVIRRSLVRSRELNRKVDEAVGLLNLGASARLHGQPDDALTHFRAARDLGDVLSMPSLVAAGWMGEANVHLAGGDRSAADIALAAARRVSKARGFGAAAADADLSSAAVALAEGKTDKCERLLERARVEVADIEVESVRASMLLTVGQLQRELGRPEAATVSLEESMRLFERAGIDVGRAHVLQYRGAWALQDQDLPRAERLLEEARAIQRRFQVPLALADTHRHLASLRLAQSRLDEALTFAQEAVEAFAGARALEAERATLVVLASVHSARDELPAARAAALRAIRLAEQVGDSTEAHSVSTEVVIIDAASGSVDEAIARLDAIPGTAFASMSARQRTRVQLQLAWALQRAGRHAEATERGQRALAATAEGGADLADLVLACREVIVFALMDDGRTEAAEAFVASLEAGGGELAAIVARRRTIDTFNAGVEASNAGDTARAVELFGVAWADGAVEEPRREAVGRALAGALLGHGNELLKAGSGEESASAFARSAEVSAAVGDSVGQARAGVSEAEVRASVGDAAAAGRLATEAAELAATTDNRRLEGDCWTIAAQSLFNLDPAGSRAAFGRALEAYGTAPETLGTRAGVTYNLAVLEFNAGSPADARVRLEEARVLATEAGRTGLVDQVESLLEALEDEE